MPRELQALCFATRQRRHGLAEAQVFKPHVGQGLEHALHFGIVAKEADRLRDRKFEHIGDRFAAHDHFEYFAAEPLAVAVRTAQVHVGQKLHLDVLEPVTAAGRAAPIAGVEAERAGGIATFFCRVGSGVDVADRIPCADIAGWIRARGFPDRRLIHHDHFGDMFGAAQLAVLSGGLGRFAFGLQETRVQDIIHQRRFSRTRYPRDADQPLQRNRDIDVLEVVFLRAEDLDARCARQHASAALAEGCHPGAPAAGKILGRQRL